MKYPKLTAFFFAALLVGTAASAQTKLPSLDASPMDMAYFPVNFSSKVSVQGQPGTLTARVIYSRPQMKGRKVFGGLVPYGKVWRLGANQATELDLYLPATIGGHQVAKGRYTLYAIPEADHWTIVLNSQTDTWGAFGYKQAKDVLRTEVPVTTLDSPVEAFSMIFEPGPGGASLVMAWEKSEVKLPITF